MAFYNDSKFNMWRACIGVIWIDSKVSSEEKKWMQNKVSNLNFTDEQREVLQNDLDSGLNLKSILPLITDKKDKAFLAHQIRVIGHLDHDFSAEEKEKLESWNDIVRSGIDLKALEEEIGKMEKESYHEDEVYKTYNKDSLFERAVNGFLKLTNKGDYKFPEEG